MYTMYYTTPINTHTPITRPSRCVAVIFSGAVIDGIVLCIIYKIIQNDTIFITHTNRIYNFMSLRIEKTVLLVYYRSMEISISSKT